MQSNFQQIFKLYGRIFTILAVFIAPSIVSAQAVVLSHNPYLFHTPVLITDEYSEITLRVQSEEGVSLITSANVLWRLPGGEFRSADMEPAGNELIYTIPSEDIKAPYIEYAILIDLTDGRSVTFPLHNPLNYPQVIAVTP